ncbi:MAG: IreB family regulatory phosphoprotein [Clostridiales bacterium]|nr:IreB family regulatory phosphoprotein [Clostridiales bacterium]
MKEKNISETQKIANPNKNERSQANEILSNVFSALTDKGYNPVNQIVGYILSGDPTYITSHKNARSNISKIERDELLEELVTYYLNNNLKG